MTRLLSRGIVVASIAIGTAAGAAQASADTGLPLQPAAPAAAESVQLPTAPGSSANEALAMQQILQMLTTLSAA